MKKDTTDLANELERAVSTRKWDDARKLVEELHENLDRPNCQYVETLPVLNPDGSTDVRPCKELADYEIWYMHSGDKEGTTMELCREHLTTFLDEHPELRSVNVTPTARVHPSRSLA